MKQYKALIFSLIVCLSGCMFTNNPRKWAQQDLEYIYDTVHKNHPGPYNAADPNFMQHMKHHYQAALQQLFTTHSDTERMTILKEFITSFNDTHMQIGFFEQRKQPQADQFVTTFSISQPDKGVMWITLPNFEPNNEEQKILQQLYNELPTFRSVNALVFDIRGNSGGNSAWAKNIVISLFGQAYACTHLDEKSEIIAWRVTEDNLMHLIQAKQNNEHAFDPKSDFMQWLSGIIDGMQHALKEKQPFYTEHEFSSLCLASAPATNPVKAKVFVLIDHGCGSAALDFIDYLKAMQYPITLVGQATQGDSVYMELRTLELPSKKGIFAFPIKVYRNRKRGHNEPYLPDIFVDTEQSTESLQNFISSKL